MIDNLSRKNKCSVNWLVILAHNSYVNIIWRLTLKRSLLLSLAFLALTFINIHADEMIDKCEEEYNKCLESCEDKQNSESCLEECEKKYDTCSSQENTQSK